LKQQIKSWHALHVVNMQAAQMRRSASAPPRASHNGHGIISSSGSSGR
jgi:hypothetical protein